MIFSEIAQAFKWFIGLFKPQDFKGNPYYWLLNQFSHIGLGLLLSWLISPYIALIFFVVWEVVQYFNSKDYKDGIEDLIFECFGVVLFLFLNKIAVILICLLLIVRLFDKYYEQ